MLQPCVADVRSKNPLYYFKLEWWCLKSHLRITSRHSNYHDVTSSIVEIPKVRVPCNTALNLGATIAQLVQHPTENPGTTLTQVWIPGGERDFSPRVNCQCRLFTVSVQPPCAIACVNVCTYVKYPKHWQSYHCLDARKYGTHWQEWVALVLWLLCLTQVRWPKLPIKDNEVLKNKFEKRYRKICYHHSPFETTKIALSRRLFQKAVETGMKKENGGLWFMQSIY